MSSETLRPETRPDARSAASVIADPNAALEAATGQTPLRAVVVGAGGMGRWWSRVIASSPMTELVGVADLVEGMPAESIAQSGVEDPSAVATGTDGVDLALEVGADILINPTVPVAHHPVTVKALHAGIPVLGEKPVTETLPEALSLMAHAELTGVPFMISQSRRFFPQVRELRRFVAAHGPTVLTSAFFSLYTEMEGYRRTQLHPLLRDMGIHAFDTARYIMDTDPVAVTARGAQPEWSVYTHDATVTATFEMSDGALFVTTAPGTRVVCPPTGTASGGSGRSTAPPPGTAPAHRCWAPRTRRRPGR